MFDPNHQVEPIADSETNGHSWTRSLYRCRNVHDRCQDICVCSWKWRKMSYMAQLWSSGLRFLYLKSPWPLFRRISSEIHACRGELIAATHWKEQFPHWWCWSHTSCRWFLWCSVTEELSTHWKRRFVLVTITIAWYAKITINDFVMIRCLHFSPKCYWSQVSDDLCASVNVNGKLSLLTRIR